MESSLNNVDESLQGEYIQLQNVNEEQQVELSQYLFSNNLDYLASAGVYQYWPIGRSVFLNNDKTMVIWVNNDDHLTFTSLQTDGDFGKIIFFIIR